MSSADRNDVEITVVIDAANLGRLTLTREQASQGVSYEEFPGDVALVPVGDGAYRLAHAGQYDPRATKLRWADIP